jgi:cell fate regulator YaaT (PSP1 superfamily)
MVIPIHQGDSGGCGSGQCGNGLEKVYPSAVVRYGYMRHVGEFRYPNKQMKFGCGANVIVQTHRGIEYGEMVSVSCDGCDKCVSRDEIKRYASESWGDEYALTTGKILRLATEEDEGDWAHIRAESLRKKRFCQERADAAKLPMKVIESEHLFGGERVIFYFMAEGRVDFRALVRGLADEFQTRIEMRQVGARDEARLLADYETCGRECCCKSFLKKLRPVNMKMAKMQKATLDPAKVSGRCGRLKCCLRYEHTTYEELNRKLPNVGKRVYTPQGAGKVVARQILTQLLQVQTEDGGRIAIAREDLIDEAEARRLQEAQAAEAARVRERDERQAVARRSRNSGGGSGRAESGRGDRRSRSRRGRRGNARGKEGQAADQAGAPNQKDDGAKGSEGRSPRDGSGRPDRSESSDAGTKNPDAVNTGADAPRANPGTGPAGEGGSKGEANKSRRRRRGRRGPRGRRGSGKSPGGGESGPANSGGSPAGD